MLGVCAAGCGRTGLRSLGEPPADAGEPLPDGAGAPDAIDGPIDALSDGPQDLASPPDAPPDRPRDLPQGGPPDLPGGQRQDGLPSPACVPAPETCNGRDDDCNGQVDDGLPAIPCPGGGHRFCVAGNLSECPQRCQACVPGSRRICFISYCTYWGVQTCAGDGRSFGGCLERSVPPECAAIARDKKRSPELERCCLDNGHCCRDEFDLDGDGDSQEMLGRCEGVRCTP